MLINLNCQVRPQAHWPPFSSTRALRPTCPGTPWGSMSLERSVFFLVFSESIFLCNAASLSLLEENCPNTNLNSCWLDVILIRHFYDFFVAPPDNWVTQLHIYAHQATKLKRYQIPTKNQWKTPKYGAFLSVLTLNK